MWILVTILLALLLGGCFFAWMHWSVWREVRKSPRIPMADCEKHGPFARKLMLTIEVPTVVDEKGNPKLIEMCPFCFDDKMKGADAILSAAKAGKL